jgi:outer membrane lipoprotein-sorting protein
MIPVRIVRFLPNILVGLPALSAHAQPEALLDKWISTQSQFHTWTADVVQTRSLKTLSQPLVATGKVRVAMPDRFRWELGQPAQTIALRQPESLYLIYPRLKRIEKYPLTDKQPGPWRDALALLEASFPRDRPNLEAHFRVLSASTSNSLGRVVLQPKSPSARKFMTEIQVSFHTTDFSPAWTQLQFSDGSTMRNDFTNGVINAPLPDSLFELKVEPGFTVVEPLLQ